MENNRQYEGAQARVVANVRRRRVTRKSLVGRFEKLMSNNKGGIVDFPLRFIPDDVLRESLRELREKCNNVVAFEELYKGAQLSKVEHSLNIGEEVSLSSTLTKSENAALEIQRSLAFWKEPKELLLTLATCCVASLTQGWDQVANGNLGWPHDFGLTDVNNPNSPDGWKFAAIQGMPWFSAAFLGSYLSDPLSEYIGRRGAVFVAAMFSFASMVGASRTHDWKALLVCRLLLGLGIGGKAAVVPILESEVLPASKRGRVLVSWQVFVATGIFIGSVACYLLRHSWRNQVLSGAIPAFALLCFAWASCESPRWLIIQGHYEKAFTTLVRLRKERVLAAKELCSIYYQIQVERWLFSGAKMSDPENVDGENPFKPELARTSYWRRLSNMILFPRIRRAAVAALIVMISQQLSGINIFAFLATNFFNTASLRKGSPEQNEIDSYKLGIGFGAANALFSTIAYFLVESEPPKADRNETAKQPDERQSNGLGHQEDDEQNSGTPAIDCEENPENPGEEDWLSEDEDGEELYETQSSHRLRGRRFLLLASLFGGTFMLAITAACFEIPIGSPARLPVIALFVMLFTFTYSPGAGCIPFLYSSEIFPNEGREIGMSWATFCNFFGAGILALFVPFGIRWGHAKILGLFCGFSAVGFILVWFFMPSTNEAATLEDMSYIFGRRLRDHAIAQCRRLGDKAVKGPRIRWKTAPRSAEVRELNIIHESGQTSLPRGGNENEDVILNVLPGKV